MTPRRFWPWLLIVAIACGIVGIANPGPVAGAPPAQTATGMQDRGALNLNAIEVQPFAASGDGSAIVRWAKGGNACTPTTCAAQGKNCGTIPNGCGGTLTCGACTAPQTCGG